MGYKNEICSEFFYIKILHISVLFVFLDKKVITKSDVLAVAYYFFF